MIGHSHWKMLISEYSCDPYTTAKESQRVNEALKCFFVLIKEMGGAVIDYFISGWPSSQSCQAEFYLVKYIIKEFLLVFFFCCRIPKCKVLRSKSSSQVRFDLFFRFHLDTFAFCLYLFLL